MTDETAVAGADRARPPAASKVAGATVARARWAILAVFFINGAVFASWVPLIPAAQQKLDLTPGVLGFALLGTAIGSLGAMPLAGAAIARLGSRPVTTAVGLVYCLALLLPVLAPSAAALFAALVAFGAVQGSSDVAMNAQGVAVERRHGHPIMSSLHGLWSLGGLAGASASGALAAAGLAPLPRALAAAFVLAACLAAATRFLLPHELDASTGGPAFARITRPLLGLGIVAFCAMMAEGSIGDWGALYLRQIAGAPPPIASAGYAAFTLTMTTGRLMGDRAAAALGPVLLARLGGALVTVGMGAALIAGQAAATLVGFALVGLALANVVPVAFSAAGRARRASPGAGIAAVSTTGYLGFLVGPPAIGVTADHLTLRGGLAIVAALGVLVALLAPCLGVAGHEKSASEPDAVSIG